MAKLKSLIEELRALAEAGLPVGTVHRWADNHQYMKTRNGWVPVPNDYKPGNSKQPVGGGSTSKTPDAASDTAKSASAAPEKAPAKKQLALPAHTGGNAIIDEVTAPPPKGAPVLKVKPDAKVARVGVCGSCVPPPPAKIPRLPNLTPEERQVETRFAEAFEKDPDGVVKEYVRQLTTGTIGDAPNVFATDDAKLLSPDYNPHGVEEEQVKTSRSVFNVAVHQTANAIVKRAFIQKLDELAKLPEDDKRRQVLVTSGGVAAGKGYAISKVDAVSNVAKEVGAVWDAAGEQNATENPWVHEECKKRGLKPIFLFVDSDPSVTWASPDRGVVERANKKGRMVDARLFADSYAHGAKNFKAFYDQQKDTGDAEFVIITSRGKTPTRLDKFPEEPLKIDAEQLYAEASKALEGKEGIKPAVLRGATVGRRIWGPPAGA